MSADNENTIREIIYKAEPVQDPLKELVQRTESDPGAPFEPEMIQLERIPVTWKRSLHVGSNWCILAG